MRIISLKIVRDFLTLHPNATSALLGWRKAVQSNRFESWADLKNVFNTVDKVGDKTVFNIGGNKFRVIAHVDFRGQILYIKGILTHRQYDQGAWRK